MYLYALFSSVAVFAAAIAVALSTARPFSLSVAVRAVGGSLLAGVGGLVSIFAADGFGWGWMDPSPGRVLMLLILGGSGVGFSIAMGTWVVSRRLRVGWLALSIGTNALIPHIPPEPEIVRLFLLTAANFLLVFGWARVGSRLRF